MKVRVSATGYIQRQLVKALEDLTVHHDGTVRDSNMNIAQFHYGEDGIMATKIETQSLPIGKLSQEEIRTQFGMQNVDWSVILKEGTVREDETAAIGEYVNDMLFDQQMMVEGVFQSKSLDSGSVFAPVNLQRMILNTKVRFGIKNTEKTDLTPDYVLNGIKKIIAHTHGYHKIWCALLRFHLAPHKLIVKERFTKEAFDMLSEIIVVTHMKSWVQPGEQVGIVAAQSIGEPATQMSCTGSTVICITDGKNQKFYGSIKDFIDPIIEANKEKVTQIAEESVVLPLENDYYIVGVSNDEKTSWKRISEVSRHPANGGLVEVVTKTGRKTTATLSHSFLKRSTTGIVPILGSDLKVGMRIPVARMIPEVPGALTEFTQGQATFKLNKEFGWLCGIYLADGSINSNTVRITKIHPVVEEKLRKICEEYGWEFSVRHYKGKFGPGKDNNIKSKDLKEFIVSTFKTGSYEKEIGGTVFHSNKEFIAGVISGYFDGDGNVNVDRQQIRVGSRSHKLIEQITALLGYQGIIASMCEEKSVRIPDKVMYTATVLKRFAREFKEHIGFNLQEKAVGLDTIIEYNERDGKHSDQEMIDKIPELGEVIAETGKLLRMPGQSRTYGRWTKKESIGRDTLEKYVSNFEDMMKVHIDDEVKVYVEENMAILKSALNADVFWDEIVDLIYHDDPKEYVYDFTVPGNDSFMVDCNVLVHNTLNSVDWHTEIVIAKNGKMITPKIGEFIDDYYLNCKDTSRIQHLPNNQIYIDLTDGNDWKALSCNEDGNMVWTKLEAITRHPVINDDGTNTILEVELESGRKVKATKGDSFLTLQNGKILKEKGSNLKIGDELPLAIDLGIEQLGYLSTLDLRDILPPTQWMYGADVNKALDSMLHSGERKWFQKGQNITFTVPYNRSDTFRDAFQHGRNSNMKQIKNGYVYPKKTYGPVSQIPEAIPLDKEFGFFCGAYIAEGMSNKTQVNITNNSTVYLQKVRDLMDKWQIGTHTVQSEKVIENTSINGTTTSIIIHSTLLAKVMSNQFGRISYEKKLPDWVYQAPDEFVKGLVDGYVSGDGSIDKNYGCVKVSSVSEKLIDGFSLLMIRYGIYGTKGAVQPKLGKFKSISTSYTYNILRKYSKVFANVFTLVINSKQERLNTLHENDSTARRKTMNDVIWDKIKKITEVPPFGEWVYDVTVEKTRNFCCKNTVLVRDTFHQAGVASKSAVTRGVPRLREILKVTQNPKATSLSIYLKPEYRNSKDKAREVVQDLELTILRNITDKIGLYWDENDESTVVEEDKQLMDFYKLFEKGLLEEEGVSDDQFSKWVLRLELNREEMFNRNISIQDIVFVIKNQFNDISVVYSDYNSQKLMMRIRLPTKSEKDKDTASQLDEFTNLKKFQNKLLNSIVIRGLPGIKAVTFRKDKQYVENIDGKYEQIEQYMLDTDGSNFIKVMNHPAVDGTRLYSTNVWDIFEVLGIEATRATLFNEINSLFESVGVNYRHLCLLCDVMTRFGRLMSIDRYGINKNDIGVLAKASFEETEKILLKAALFGEVDPVTGVSANIMMGQPIKGGTAFSQILLDDQMLPKLLESVEVTEDEVEEEGDISALVSDGIQLTDPCGSTQFQMNMIMPPTKSALDEPDIEMDIIE